MKTVQLFILLFCTAYPKCVQSDSKIKYEVTKKRLGFHDETIVFTKEVVTSGDYVSTIEILSDFPVLKKGMLEISPDTFSFYMTKRNLEKIEPGVFDNQNITGEIRLRLNKLKVISTGTFKNLRISHLDLSRNHITHLEESALSDLPNLLSITLLKNKITQHSGNSVVNTPSLKYFGIGYNNLTKLGEDSFAFIKSDESFTIAANDNDIEDIDGKAFDGIVLNHLYLQHNKIKKISADVFKNQSRVYLDLRNNQVASLPEELLRQKKVFGISLEGNPLLCDIKEKTIKLDEKFDVDKFIEEHSKCFSSTD